MTPAHPPGGGARRIIRVRMGITRIASRAVHAARRIAPALLLAPALCASAETPAPTTPTLLPGAGSRLHAWAALPPTGEAPALTPLCHLPAGSPPGTLRFAPRQRHAPVALGAWGERVFLVHEFERDERTLRRVESIRVEPAAAGR